MPDKKATLSFGNESVELPIYSPTLGNDAIDVRSLGSHQHFTFDQGFYATAACESSITFIDGDKGVLLYRGYPIDQLAFGRDYIDVCYLLIYGELPAAQEKRVFQEKVAGATKIDTETQALFAGFSKDAHPMGIILSVMGALSTKYAHLDITKHDVRETAVIELIGKIPVVAAMAYRHNQGKSFVAPNNNVSYAENFLHMLFGHDDEKVSNPVLVRAMDRIFTLHADHEQNASTATVRMAGSTGTNPFAAISAGICALWGPAHGGANEACLNMLKEIGDEAHIEHYIEKAKDKNDPFRLMGFGHRVYKSYDPRAKVMQKTCHEVLQAVDAKSTPLFKLAVKLEKIALEDPYFIEKKLYPNVDFYSGLTLNAMDIPSNLFTVIFALARTVGWASHWFEMFNEPNHPIYRPRQLYMGKKQRNLS